MTPLPALALEDTKQETYPLEIFPNPYHGEPGHCCLISENGYYDDQSWYDTPSGGHMGYHLLISYDSFDNTHHRRMAFHLRNTSIKKECHSVELWHSFLVMGGCNVYWKNKPTCQTMTYCAGAAAGAAGLGASLFHISRIAIYFPSRSSNKVMYLPVLTTLPSLSVTVEVPVSVA